MKPNHPHIVLYQPEIPQNAGNIGRLAAATQSRLHLVKPFGFSADDKNLKRAGLDYWPFLDLEIHNSLEALWQLFPQKKYAFFSKKGTTPYSQIPIDTDLLIFGRETSGLPEELWKEYPDNFYQIPMFHQGVRSLNLANSVSIVTYHLLHKRNLFP